MAALWPMLRPPVAVLRMTRHQDRGQDGLHHQRLPLPAGRGDRVVPARGHIPEHQLQEQRGADRPGELDHPVRHHPFGGEHPAGGEAEGHRRVDVQSRQRPPGVDHGHHHRAGRDHRRGPADRAAAHVMVDHPRSGRHRHQHERAQELDDQPDPQRPLPQGVFLEPDQVTAPERCSVFIVHIGGDICHGALPVFVSQTALSGLGPRLDLGSRLGSAVLDGGLEGGVVAFVPVGVGRKSRGPPRPGPHRSSRGKCRFRPASGAARRRPGARGRLVVADVIFPPYDARTAGNPVPGPCSRHHRPRGPPGHRLIRVKRQRRGFQRGP